MKLISFIVSRHSFGTRLARVPNGRDGCTFVGWRRAERPHIERQGDYSVDSRDCGPSGSRKT
jgi:hypothetical protein